MEIAILAGIALCLILMIVLLVRSGGSENVAPQMNMLAEQSRAVSQQMNQLAEESRVASRQMSMLAEQNRAVNQQMYDFQRGTGENLNEINRVVSEKMQVILDRKINEAFDVVVKNMNGMGASLREGQEKEQRQITERLGTITEEFAALRRENQLMLDKLREENQKSLDKINDTVNEKLQKTLNDRISQSFETVNKRLAEVYAGLGEMKSVASGVSDLKNVLANVKNRGIVGEIQLSAILDDILAPNQYETQFQIIPEKREMVDFAVRLPGPEDGTYVYLPIDSKFPGDKWASLAAAYDLGDAEEIRTRRELLVQEIRRAAKSIHDKYIIPPHTTDFAIMFLPFEGLYAEVVNMGLVENLQREYQVNITGPSTMAALLNSLQMGFRTLAIQKKSGEVWTILEAAKKEFATFGEVLESVKKRLQQADNDLDMLIGRRTRAINRKLKTVTKLDEAVDAGEILELELTEE